MVIDIPHAKDWARCLRLWGESLHGDEILLLRGDLAAGKTTMVSGLLQILGPGTTATASPTYALHHRYQPRPDLAVDHWDLYRVQSLDELDAAGFWEFLNDRQSLVMVEWPQIIPAESWPEDRLVYEVEIAKRGEGRRVEIHLVP